MANDFNQPLYDEDEIDLRKIIKILIESKKLIISTILIFTTASIIYSLSLKPSFLTSTKLEIGYFEMPDGTKKLIEKPSDLISNLKIFQLLNDQQDSSFKTIENKLISIETSSNKATDNEKILSSIITFINNRHNELSIISSNLRKNTLVDQIDLIDSCDCHNQFFQPNHQKHLSLSSSLFFPFLSYVNIHRINDIVKHFIKIKKG